MDKVMINGVELEVDFTDAETFEKVQTAVDHLDEFEETDKYDVQNVPDTMRHVCKGYNRFFDEVFGAGTSDKLFQGRNSVKEHKDAFIQMTDICNKQINDTLDFSDAIQRYSPNRAERRAQQKQQSSHYNRHGKHR